jgi:hypothetical protein
VELIAAEVERRCHARQAQRQELHSLAQAMKPIDELQEQLERAASRMLDATLLSAGFYRQHRNWRGIRRARILAESR